ncbi:MAG: rhamnan synthesis F family protein [Pseudomonadota bacterium]
MIPRWKLRREAKRIIEKVRELPRRLIEPVLRWNYDRTRWSRIEVNDAENASTEKICVLLVYQPNEFAKSLLETCRFMTAKGYAVLVVANGGLLAHDRATLQKAVWRVMERPNFGYDFGGYRDAIHFLMREEIDPCFLLLMNDSIWFPMNRQSSAIEQLEASKFDLTGLFLHVPSRNEFAKEERRSLLRRKLAPHIESYVTMIPRHTYGSEAFRSFWRNYPQTNSKTLTIRRGEIGFSKAIAAVGMRVGGLSRRSLFLSEIATRSNDFLTRTLQYAAYTDAAFASAGKSLLEAQSDPDWREKALIHIREVVERRRFNASFCWATEKIFDTSFVKKNPDRLFQLSRARFLQALDNGDLAADNISAIEEMRMRVKRDQVIIEIKVAS